MQEKVKQLYIASKDAKKQSAYGTKQFDQLVVMIREWNGIDYLIYL